MRSWIPAFALLALVALPQRGAAGPLVAAELTLELGPIVPIVVATGDATGEASGPSQALLDGGTAFATTTTRQLLPGIGATWFLTANDPGSFGGDPLRGTAAIRGILRLQGLAATIGTVPLAIGGNAEFTTLIGYTGFFDSLAIDFGRWTAGTAAAFTGIGIQTRLGSNGLGANGAGHLVLVSPIAVSSATTGILGGFGTLELTYVPEPGTALLLGWGAICLGLAGRRRQRA